jgi:hypothetical protein
MIIRFLFVSFLLCIVNTDSYADGKNAKELKKPIVKSVTIKINAGADEDSNMPPHALEPCDDFSMTEADILEFFKKAEVVDERDYEVVLYTSRCFVSGKAILKNGREAGWKIDRFRRGTMWFLKSEKFPNIPNDVYFFCGTCRSDKYYEACDVKCALDDLRR